MYKVFIVEDEHLIRDSLRHQIMTLAKQYPIVYSDEAADGELALASILDLRPDIIISDIKMPFMDGLVFAKEAKKLLPQVRIILLAALMILTMQKRHCSCKQTITYSSPSKTKN